MRTLMARQKKVLEKAMIAHPDITSVDDMPNEIWEALVKINDTEILWQEVNRWIHDYRWSRIA